MFLIVPAPRALRIFFDCSYSVQKIYKKNAKRYFNLKYRYEAGRRPGRIRGKLGIRGKLEKLSKTQLSQLSHLSEFPLFRFLFRENTKNRESWKS